MLYQRVLILAYSENGYAYRIGGVNSIPWEKEFPSWSHDILPSNAFHLP